MKTALALFSYGGVEGRVMDALLEEINLAATARKVLGYTRVHGDALISRSRSKALTDFLASEFSTLVMVDHDIEWEPGMVVALAEEADKRKCLMSGLYSCRAKGAGHAGRFSNMAQVVHPGADERYDAEYLPGGFLAIPRLVAEEVLKAGTAAAAALQHADANMGMETANEVITECIGLDGKPMYDFFRPIVVPSTIVAGRAEYLSEDWSFCWRARQANKARPQYIWAKPILLHWGQYGFSIFEAGQLKPPATKIH